MTTLNTNKFFSSQVDNQFFLAGRLSVKLGDAALVAAP